MKIVVEQMNIINGHCEENFLYMQEAIKKAIQDQQDMIVFPQNAISGYYLGDKWLDKAWCQYVDSFNDKIIALSKEIAIVWGNIKCRRNKLFNCAFFAYEEKTNMSCHHNHNHRFQNDSRYFEELDMHASFYYQGLEFALNFGTRTKDVNVNINLDFHPYSYQSKIQFDGDGIYLNALNMSALSKNVILSDGVCQFQLKGKKRYQSKGFEVTSQVFDLFKEKDIACDEDPSLLAALVYGIKEFDEQLFQKRFPWILGLSGGLDSSVSATLFCLALGKERLITYNMATKNNTDKTKDNARTLAEALGVLYHKGSIEPLVDSTVDVLAAYGYEDNGWNSLVVENIQARIRGHLLSSFASVEGGLIINNGNKVEVALGYCTLYGDSVGALAAIGDVTKVRLFDLAREINEVYGKEVIPHRLLPELQGSELVWEMPPSAELKEAQFDPMKWFYHDYVVEEVLLKQELASFMKSYADDSIYDTPVAKWLRYYHLDEPATFIEDLTWLLQTTSRNGFKLVQLPPLIVVSDKAYGNDVLSAQMSFDSTIFDEWKKVILNK